jgi:ATP-dependent Clp protease, protease subunit
MHIYIGILKGVAADIEIHAKEIIDTRRRLNKIYAKHCKKDLDSVEKSMDRDFFMTPEQAKAYGIVDQVVADRASGKAI